MTTDILDLPGWTVLAKRLEDREYELEAEYTVKPTACQKCGVLDRLYRHGTKDTIYRDSPIRGHATRILARVQRYKCRECGETFLQPLAGIQEDRRMTARCAEYIKEQCLRDTFTSIADHVGCD
ncbi:MAG: Burkholderia virus Bcep22, partial [Pseudomonadota bacterium]